MRNVFVITSVLVGSGFLVFNSSSTGKSAPAKTDKSTRTTIAAEKKASRRFGINPAPVGNISIVIDKSDYELSVYDDKGWYATYPVVFGNNSLADKKMEGDKNTPEGSFKIINKKSHEKWHRFIGINYPTKESYEKFAQRKKRGEIPASASIGGAIGIHGTWPNEDFVIDRYKNWTLGCISMKRKEVEEIYGFTPVGASVTIRK